jgi:AraC-like DNA-binding protein
MARCSEAPLSYHPLHESPLVTVHDYRCGEARSGPSGEEESWGHAVVLMRHGAFARHFGRRSATADVNQAAFFAKGAVYRVSHPAEDGDRGTVFSVNPRVLADIVRVLDPSVDDHPDRPFPFLAGPCATGLFFRHRELVQRLERAEAQPLEPFWADITALQLVADALTAAFEASSGAPRTRPATEDEHVERTEAVKTYLASRLAERVTLDEVARAVDLSPFHLARLFHRRTGVPLHRYLTRLRLRASLERLAAGATDLTALALELGFASHSHFADTFRKEFGTTPSQVRATSKIPEA